ncbi:hypothetical protein NDU88_001046 [Pleurodeles waltl]|uniref:Uncharacterized protein n=1 Tax=Pleurodeles waltl TaxID=8319 RepID=A0AAV7Q352_PLEWA|nr:hypothetical protein NDU88_001046 [Pleurodeles waltl]
MSRSQPSTSATKSASAVVPATAVRAKGAPVRAANVPPTEKKDHPIPPPEKVKKGPASSRGQSHYPPSKASPKPRVDSAKVPAATVKMGKGHKPKGTSPLGTMSPGEGLVTTRSSGMAATCTTVTTTTSTATCTPPALPLPQRQSAASSPRISHPRLQETVWCLHPPQQSLAPRPALAASPPQTPPPAPPSAPPRAQPMPLCRISAPSPVCTRQSLQVPSWTLDTALKAPPPALT